MRRRRSPRQPHRPSPHPNLPPRPPRHDPAPEPPVAAEPAIDVPTVSLSALVAYVFERETVRVVDRDGEVWFELVDVCRVLAHSNPSKAADVLDEDERMTMVPLCRTGVARRCESLS